MHSNQRQAGPSHRSGRRKLRPLASTHPIDVPVRTDHVDRSARGELPDRRERIDLRSLRVQRWGCERTVEAERGRHQQRQREQVRAVPDSGQQQEGSAPLVVAQQPKESED